MAAGLNQGYQISEWSRHHDRSFSICAESPTLGSASVAASGSTWNSCSTHSRYAVVTNADHPIASLEQHSGGKMVDPVAAFVK